jgi:hypothetical protein
MNNEKWREWKKTHTVSIATWSVLLCIIPVAYFAKRLTNEGKLKRACEFQDKFPEVLHFLRNFLRLKNNFSISGGSAKFRTLTHDSLEFGRDRLTTLEIMCPLLSLIFETLRGTVSLKIKSRIPILVSY